MPEPKQTFETEIEKRSSHREKMDQYPEKVMQFGTGVLLKGLPDYLIQKANEAGVFCGRIAMVKSTSRPGNPDETLPYWLFENGIMDKQTHQQIHWIDAVSRELSASKEWDEVLRLACSKDLEVVISNTTEAGLVFVPESVFSHPPESFPAKITAVLHARYKAGLTGLVIIPCELIPDNGRLLKELVLKQAGFNQLDNGFISWLETENEFCNSLVDRIVSGFPSEGQRETILGKFGHTNLGVIESEPYALWAIECSDKVRRQLGWEGIHKNWILQNDISVYRERKLRILNGTHTIMVALGLLKGHETVLDCMNDPEMSRFVEEAALREIAPATPVDPEVAHSFAGDVLDRFRNPHIRHRLINITLQFSMKMAMRNLPTIALYEERFGKAPETMAKGFAAYLVFMRPTGFSEGKWYGKLGDKSYEIQDDKAGIFHRLSQEKEYASLVLDSEELWKGFVFSEDFKSRVLHFYSEMNPS